MTRLLTITATHKFPSLAVAGRRERVRWGGTGVQEGRVPGDGGRAEAGVPLQGRRPEAVFREK